MFKIRNEISFRFEPLIVLSCKKIVIGKQMMKSEMKTISGER
jgi:hypothetical protein